MLHLSIYIEAIKRFVKTPWDKYWKFIIRFINFTWSRNVFWNFNTSVSLTSDWQMANTIIRKQKIFKGKRGHTNDFLLYLLQYIVDVLKPLVCSSNDSNTSWINHNSGGQWINFQSLLFIAYIQQKFMWNYIQSQYNRHHTCSHVNSDKVFSGAM